MNNKILTTPKFSLPKIGLGTYKLQGNKGIQAIESALRIGYTHIDTAQMYDNEIEVGKAIANSNKSREEIFLTTKIWPANFQKLTQATEESLKKLKTEQVDLLLLHWPAADLNDTKKGIELLNEILHKSYAKHVGVSNFNIELLNHALGAAPIVCNQVEYHPYLSQKTLLSFMREKDLALIAYQPLAHANIMDDRKLLEIAATHNKEVAQVALRWLIQQEAVAAIPKSGSAERQKENINVLDFELSDAEMKEIFELNTTKHLVNASTAPEWDK